MDNGSLFQNYNSGTPIEEQQVLRRSSPYGQKGIADGGKILLKKILFIPEDGQHYMIEIV